MVEMLATIALLGILLVMAVGGLINYFSAKSLETSVRELTTQIRAAQTMAVSTGKTHRIDFSGDPESYTLQRHEDTGFVVVKGPISLEGGVELDPSSLSFGTDLPQYLDFFAQGTCEGGQGLLRERFGKERLIEVDAETVNVSVH